MIAKKRPTRAQLKAEFEKATKLWQILRIALHDLKACENAKGVTIDMSEWYNALAEKKCRVCLAGAVLRCRIIPKAAKGYFSSHPDHTQDWKTSALNCLRTGDVGYALSEQSIDNGERTEHRLDREIVAYEDDRQLWWAQMQQLLRDLRKAKL